MPNFTQDGRMLEVDAGLGKDALLLVSVQGTEAISRPFSFTLNLLSKADRLIQPDQVVGKRIAVRIRHPVELRANNPKLENARWINGFASRFAVVGKDHWFNHYRMEIVPWFWFLSRVTHCRVFHEMKPSEVILKVLRSGAAHGGELKNSLGGGDEKREYIVQYRETDFNFVSRLMEQYGFFYYFDHTDKQHTMVLADSTGQLKACPDGPSLDKNGNVNIERGGYGWTDWQRAMEFRSGKYSLTDWNFQEPPRKNLLVSSPSKHNVGNSSPYEIYDYPGEYPTTAEGGKLAKLYMEEEEASLDVSHGVAEARNFVAGYTIDLSDALQGSPKGTYVLTQVMHTATVGDAYHSDGGGDGDVYSVQFSCVQKSVPYRPPRITPKPVVQGPQTAIVISSTDSDTGVDKYGRIKVKFHWEKQGEDSGSCWVRVAQIWASKKYGAVFIPRVDDEVIVEFLEGDPDRPIVTGCVYNDDKMPPYDLPKHRTRSTIKSQTMGGGGFNEIRFEDKSGAEQLFLHAEKDMDVRVKEESREWVGKSRHLMVQADLKEKVSGEHHVEIVKKDVEKVGMDKHLQVGKDYHIKTSMNHAHEAGMNVHIKGGMNVVVEAGLMLTLKGPGGFVVIGPTGVIIQGTMVLINSGGSAGSGSGSSPGSPAAPDQADDGSKGTKM